MRKRTRTRGRNACSMISSWSFLCADKWIWEKHARHLNFEKPIAFTFNFDHQVWYWSVFSEKKVRGIICWLAIWSAWISLSRYVRCVKSHTINLEREESLINICQPCEFLLALVQPSIHAQSSIVQAHLGKSTHLRCSGLVPHDTTIYWRRLDHIDSPPIQSNRFRQQQHTNGKTIHSTLHIKDVEKSDFGHYACLAESKGGISQATIDLKGKRSRIFLSKFSAWWSSLI